MVERKVMKKQKMKTYPKNWTFKSKYIVRNFDNHVRQSVPQYDEVQSMVSEMAKYFVRDNDTVLDLGVSTGTTIKSINKEISRKNVTYHGIDNSKEMLDIADKKLKGIKHDLVYSDLNNGLNCAGHNFSLCISLFTLQFINLENRVQLLREIRQSLRDGGAFIMIEKIVGSNAHFNEMYSSFYHDMKIRNGLTPDENDKKSRSLRGIMYPVSLDENKRFLMSSGFSNIDVFFKWYNFVGIIAIK